MSYSNECVTFGNTAGVAKGEKKKEVSLKQNVQILSWGNLKSHDPFKGYSTEKKSSVVWY